MNTFEHRQKIWDSIPFDVKSKKLSYSRIKDLLVSIKEYINGIANPKEQTEAMKLGSLFELLLLQPEQFDKKYFIKPEYPVFKSMADQKKDKVADPITIDEQKAAFEKIVADSANGKITIKPEMYAQAMRMVNAFIQHPLASALISQENVFQQKFEIEISGIDIQGYLDILCRAKEDIIVSGVPIVEKGYVYIVDIKKTNSIEDSNISKQVREYKYYIQSFLYRKAIEAYAKHGKIALAPDQLEIPVYYIFQEDNCPYDTHVTNFGIMADQMAINEIVKAIKLFKTLLTEPETIFFGINAGVTTIDLSAWVEKDFKEKEKHVIYTPGTLNNFQSFMIEKELDLTICKPSISITLENVMNQIAAKKAEIAAKSQIETVDKQPEIVQNPQQQHCEAHTSTDCTKPAEGVPSVDSESIAENGTSEVGKRKRRTKAEIEAARAAEAADLVVPEIIPSVADAPENIQIDSIFSAALTAEIKEPEIIFSQDMGQSHTIESLIEYANSIKSFASGLYAVKKAALVLGYFKDMSLVDLNTLDENQKHCIYQNLKVCKENEAGLTDALKF